MSRAPRATACAPSSRTSVRAFGSRRTNATEPPREGESDAASSPTLTGAAIASRAGTTSSAATAQIAAPTPNTTPGVLTVSTTPTSSGPPSVLTPSIQLETTFVAASSSGSLARPGATADCVGRVTVNATDGRTSSPYTASRGAPASIAAATTAQETAWPRYPTMSTLPGGYRSPKAASGGAPTAAGTSIAVASTPAAVTPPCAYA